MLIINNLPIFPLDGFRIIDHFLSIFYEEEYRYDFMKYVSMVGLVIFSIVILITQSFGLFLICCFLTFKQVEFAKKTQLMNIQKKIFFTNYFNFYSK